MENTGLRQLFVRYLAGEATPEEVKLLILQFGRKETEAELRAAIRRQLESGHDMPEQAQQAWEPVLQDAYEAIKAKMHAESEKGSVPVISPRIGRRKWWYSAAAAIILLVATAGLLFVGRQGETQPEAVALRKNDIAPGGNKAILTLANGARIILDSTKKGIIFVQGNTKIIKPGSGLLTYHKSDNSRSKVLFNTISTPKGGQYQVILSDGTKVWLNAASSIHFPNEFTGKTREVRVTGEAYFEVADNVNKPFKVLVNDMAVQVLGTHFNVMAYKNEPVSKITLLEGAVKVTGGSKDVLLKPGQQAQISPDGRLIKVNNVDLHGAIAWKNNQFWFDDDDIHSVMRQLSRWYNMDVVIKGDIPQHFGGYISRNIYVSKVFEALQATGHIQYKIQDSTIIVSP